MKKVCQNWEQAFPAEAFSGDLFGEFEKRATTIAAEVIRVQTLAEGVGALLSVAKEAKVRKVVAVECPLQKAAGVNEALRAAGLEVHTDPEEIAAHAETADLGVSGVEFGVAESGSVLQDAYAIESRLVSTLPPIHAVFMNSRNIVPGIQQAIEIVAKVFDRGYVTFIGGPSRTADIERVLTIGVHGPSRFIIIAVDEQLGGGIC